jgi:hypothetical protein
MAVPAAVGAGIWASIRANIREGRFMFGSPGFS